MAQQTLTATEEEEINKIMKEIETLEKTIEPIAQAQSPASSVPPVPVVTQSTEVPHSTPVVNAPLTQVVNNASAIPTRVAPLPTVPTAGNQGGSFSLKVGECTQLNLEFEQAGIIVTVAYSPEALTIFTNQGAEFRVPFKRAA